MPVWCEVVADTLTPVACFANVVGEGTAFSSSPWRGGSAGGVTPSWAGGRSPRSRHGGERSRRRADWTWSVRRRNPGRRRGPRGALPVARSGGAASVARRAGGVSRLRRGPRGRATARPAARRPRPSRRRVGGDRAVLRVRPLAPARRPRRQRGGARCARRRCRRRGGHGRLRIGLCPVASIGVGLRPAGTRVGRHGGGTAAWARPGRGGADDDLGGVQGGHRGGEGAHPGRRHLPGRAVAALRPDTRSGSLRRLPCPSTAQSEPVPLLPPLS